jgi:hypothetical protein
MDAERGMIGRLPYLGLGSGPPLLFLAGLSLEAGVDAAGTERMNASLLRPFAKRRRVLFVNRRSGLPRGVSMAELAEEHADAIRASCSSAPPAGSDRMGESSSAGWPRASGAGLGARRLP